MRAFDWLTAGLLAAAPLMPVEAAAIAGSEFLADWNLIVFDNLDSRSRIEGKSFVGGETRIRDADPKGGGKDTKDIEPEKPAKAGDGKHEDYTEEVARQREELIRAARGLSEHLRSLAATDKTPIEGDALRIKAAEKTSVFDLSLEDLDRIGEIRFDIPDGSTVILNVAGKAGTISGKVDVAGIGKDSQLIWNFYEAEDLRLKSDFYGTLLSPYASVRNDRSVEGTLVAASLDQRGELRMGNHGYQAEAPSLEQVSAAPEPAAWLMMITGFGLVGGSLRRRADVGVALPAA